MIGKGAPAGKADACGQNDRSVSSKNSLPQSRPRNLDSKKSIGLRSVLARELPRLGVFPRDVDGVVEVEQQASPAVEDYHAEQEVVDERGQRAQNDVDETEASVPLGNRQLGTQ